MSAKQYIIAGPNGAGKTTASYTLLPELWDCREYVNADEIARGLSPFHPEKVAIEAGRLQLERINTLLHQQQTFAIETNLATKTYRKLVDEAHLLGYEVILLFLFLPSQEDAVRRVRLRVLSGGHNIQEDVIRRRYDAGLRNFFKLYMPIVDHWSFVNNKVNPAETIAFRKDKTTIISDPALFESIKLRYE